MIIDAKDHILGRLGTIVAKKALLGEEVVLLNTKDMVITGDKYEIIRRYQNFRQRGIHTKGPFYSRRADFFVKRALRGMLPYKNTRGREALSRIKCYTTVPEDMQDKKPVTFKEAHVSKVPNMKYMRVGELCKLLGGRS